MSFETEDLRKKPLNELTDQQLKSRLHLVRDEQLRLQKEFEELERMEGALREEMWKRTHGGLVSK